MFVTSDVDRKFPVTQATNSLKLSDALCEGWEEEEVENTTCYSLFEWD